MRTETQSDEDLVSAFLVNGDEELFRLLYRRHTPRLYLFLLRLCAGDRAKAEDLLQESWIKAVRNLSKFEWKSRLSSWLHGIALNSYRDHRPNIETRAEAEEFEAKRDDMDVSLDLEASIRRLPDRCREIFVLHDIEGYTHEEISRLLNIKNGTSKSQLFEARKKLREWLSTGSTKEGLK